MPIHSLQQKQQMKQGFTFTKVYISTFYQNLFCFKIYMIICLSSRCPVSVYESNLDYDLKYFLRIIESAAGMMFNNEESYLKQNLQAKPQ